MLADSNILIYAIQPNYAGLRRWLLAELPAVSVITRVEVLGYHQLRQEEAAALHALFNALEILYPNYATFEHAIALRQQRKISLGDALIAATALEHGLRLATHNTADFQDIDGLAVFDPLSSTIHPTEQTP